MKTRLSARARREVLRIDEHWRSVADHRTLFVEELEALLTRLARDRSLGVPYDAATEERVWRTRLVKSQYYVYYTRNLDEVVVVSVWSAFRRRQPKL